MGLKSIESIWLITLIILSALLTVISKFAFNQGVDPLNFSWQILLVSSGFLFVLGLAKEKKAIMHFNPHLLWNTILVGFTAGGLSYAFSLSGLKLSNAINYSFLSQSSIFFTSLFALIFLKEIISRKKWLLLTFLLIGTYLISTSGKQLFFQRGDILILLGSVSYSFGLIFSRKSLDKISIITFSTYRALFGALSIMAFLLLIGKISFNINWEWTLLTGLIIATGILAMNKVLVYAGAIYLAMMNAIIPVATAVLAYFTLGEKLDFIQSLGAILIIISTIFITKASTKI